MLRSSSILVGRNVLRVGSAQHSINRSFGTSLASSTAVPDTVPPKLWKLGILNHVAIAVPDLEKSIRFYRDLLGAKCSEPVAQPDHGVYTVFVEFGGGGTKIELLHPYGNQSPIANFLSKRPDGGIHHVCLEVSDIKAAMKELTQQHGIRSLDKQPKIGAHGKPVIFLHPKDCLQFIRNRHQDSGGVGKVIKVFRLSQPHPLLFEDGSPEESVITVQDRQIPTESVLTTLVYRLLIEHASGSKNVLHIYLISEFHAALIPMMEHLHELGNSTVQFTLIHSKPVRSKHPILSQVELLCYPEFQRLQPLPPVPPKSEKSSVQFVISVTKPPLTVKKSRGETTESEGKKQEPAPHNFKDPIVFLGVLQSLYELSIQSKRGTHRLSDVSRAINFDFKLLGFRKFKHMMEAIQQHKLISLTESTETPNVEPLAALTPEGFVYLLVNNGGQMLAEPTAESQKRSDIRRILLDRFKPHFSALICALIDRPERVWDLKGAGNLIPLGDLKAVLEPFLGPLLAKYLLEAKNARLIDLIETSSSLNGAREPLVQLLPESFGLH